MENKAEPYELFFYALNSPVSRGKYSTRLRRFLTHLKLEGTIEEQCRALAAKGRENPDELIASIFRFLQEYRDKVDRKEISASTIKNYVKAVKLFCEMNDILLPWKITRGLPRRRRWVNDHAPTIEEIRKLCEYPDWRMRAIIYTMASSGIREGAWDYLKWSHVKPVERDGKVAAASLIVYAGEEDEEYLLKKMQINIATKLISLMAYCSDSGLDD